MSLSFLQATFDRFRCAQNLLVYSVAEGGHVMAVVAELYRVPDDYPAWVGTANGSVAIFCGGNSHPPCVPFTRGKGYACVE